MHVKTLRLVTLLVWGFCGQAFAEVPSLSLPPLPGDEPELSTESKPAEAPKKKRDFSQPQVPAIPAAPKNPSASAPMPPEAPGMNFDTPQDQLAAAKAMKDAPDPIPQVLEPEETATKESPDPIPNLLDEKPPELPSDDTAENEKKSVEKEKAPKVEKSTPAKPVIADSGPPPLPDFGMDAPPPLPSSEASAASVPNTSPTKAPPALDLALPNDGTAPIIGQPAEEAKPEIKSWQYKLAPSYKPKTTKFNYKRVVLSPEIYRSQYNADNRHLPIRQTDELRQYWFAQAVMRNHVDGVRAFLNAGLSPRMTTSDGSTMVQLALRFGAMDVANLLIARGGGSGGGNLTAYDLARMR